MDDSSPCANAVSEDTGYKSNVYNPSCGKPLLNHKQYICSYEEETGDCMKEEASKGNPLIVQELGDVLGGYMHAQEPPEQLFSLHETPYQEKNIGAAGMSQEFDRSGSLVAKMPKILTKSATFSCSQNVQLCSLSVKGRHGLPCTEWEDQSSLKSERLAYARSLSLPGSIKLVSAMKGGRERNGETPKMDLHVKWAAEVHDPPATSMSHTVRSNYQRPKSKKKEKDRRRQKQNKGKSSRGSGSESKQTNWKISGRTTDPNDSRSQATSERSLLDKCGCSDVEVLDYAVTGQEFKCGSSLMKESLTKVHVSFAEAS